MKKLLLTLPVILLLAAGCRSSQQVSVPASNPTTKPTEQTSNPAATSTASQTDKKHVTITVNSNSNVVCPEPSTSQYLAENVNQTRLTPQIYSNDMVALSAARSFLINRLGKNIYNCNLTLAMDLGVGPQNSYDPNEHIYRVEYLLKPQSLTGVSVEVRIIVDTSNGQATMVPGGYLGIPDCANTPEKCGIKINAQKAKALAIQAGAVSPGLATFYYDGASNVFAWMLDENVVCPYRTFKIDATSGLVLSQAENRCIPPPSH